MTLLNFLKDFFFSFQSKTNELKRHLDKTAVEKAIAIFQTECYLKGWGNHVFPKICTDQQAATFMAPAPFPLAYFALGKLGRK